MFTRSILSIGFFAALALAQSSTTTSSASVPSGNVTAPTCFWANGTAADTGHLQPCKTSLGNDGFFACCPPQGANDLYPLDYPLCTENGLCKAGNSAFIARGGCTDKSGKSKSCPQYCPKIKTGAMLGLTNCEGRSPYYCCNAEHDSGECNCSPPNGTAFQLQGTTPLFYKDLVSGGNKTSTNGTVSSKTTATKSHASTCESTVHKTKTVKVTASTSSAAVAQVSTIFAAPPQPTSAPVSTKPAAASGATISSSNPAATHVVNFGLAVFAAGVVLLN